MRRYIAPLLFGLIGAGILISLGIWQVQRLAWKQAVIAERLVRLNDAPVALPAAPDPAGDRFLPVTATGRLTGEGLEVLASLKEVGAGVRVIAVLETDGRRVLVDRGFVPEEARSLPRDVTDLTVTGTLHWPQEVDGFTPPPDLGRNLWFARDVPAMAAALNTEPVLIVATQPTGDEIMPLPVDTAGIPNDHLEYAVTWFSLAAVWLGMTGLLLWRIRRRTV